MDQVAFQNFKKNLSDELSHHTATLKAIMLDIGWESVSTSSPVKVF